MRWFIFVIFIFSSAAHAAVTITLSEASDGGTDYLVQGGGIITSSLTGSGNVQTGLVQDIISDTASGSFFGTASSGGLDVEGSFYTALQLDYLPTIAPSNPSFSNTVFRFRFAGAPFANVGDAYSVNYTGTYSVGLLPFSSLIPNSSILLPGNTSPFGDVTATVVPEPSSALLSGLSLCTLLLKKRRCRG